MAIQVYGPPPTSGTRDSFAELILEKGCDSDPAMKALKESDKDKHKDLCTKIREDGAYIEAGENDNLLVQKVAANPGAIGVLGYSFLEENGDKVRGIPLGGIAPTAETISSFTYPGARQLYLYVKGEHLNVIPGMREFLAEYAKAWAPGRLSRAPRPDPLAGRRAGQRRRGGDEADADDGRRAEVRTTRADPPLQQGRGTMRSMVEGPRPEDPSTALRAVPSRKSGEDLAMTPLAILITILGLGLLAWLSAPGARHGVRRAGQGRGRIRCPAITAGTSRSGRLCRPCSSCCSGCR